MSKIEYLSPEGFRQDGRYPHELRSIACQIGGFSSQANGSACVSMGQTKAVAIVFGPSEPKGGRREGTGSCIINCEVATAPCSSQDRRIRRPQDKQSIVLSQMVSDIFKSVIITDRYPKSTISIFVYVIAADGGVRSAVINSAMLALVNAGVLMRDFASSCSVGFVDNIPIVDLTQLESVASGSELLLAINNRSTNCSLLHLTTRLPMDKLKLLYDAGIQGCMEISDTLQRTVFEYAQHRLGSQLKGPMKYAQPKKTKKLPSTYDT